ALAGDLGYSRLFSVPVWGALLPRLGNSLMLMLPSFVLAFALALGLGTAAARRPGSRLDAAVNLFCFAGISLPTFWLALILILVAVMGNDYNLALAALLLAAAVTMAANLAADLAYAWLDPRVSYR